LNALLIAGTDAGVGKTVLTRALTAYWQRYRAAQSMGILEPIQHGLDNCLEKAWQQFEILSQQHEFVLLESQGGLGAAITHETTLADLAWDWRVPTLLVVPVQSGAIAQAVANVALARQCRVHLKGIVLNCVRSCHAQELEEWAPIDLLQSLTQKPVLGCIPHLADPTDLSKLVQVASNLTLERIMPI
jgi:dethiobiotin synthetase